MLQGHFQQKGALPLSFGLQNLMMTHKKMH